MKDSQEFPLGVSRTDRPTNPHGVIDGFVFGFAPDLLSAFMALPSSRMRVLLCIFAFR